MRLLVVIAALLTVMITVFALWGAGIESLVAGEAALEWYRSQGLLGGVAIAALLVADVILPVPTTPLLTLLGSLYGPLTGGLLGSAGSLVAGVAAYALARLAPRRATARLLGRRDLDRLERYFGGSVRDELASTGDRGAATPTSRIGTSRHDHDACARPVVTHGPTRKPTRKPTRTTERNWGGWTVALSRWLPMLPEVVALLAGLGGMPPHRFLLALVCGTIPMAFAFAALGAGLANRPILATLIAALVPALLWSIVRGLRGRAASSPDARGGRPTDDP